MDKVPMTAEGYAALEAEIKYLKTVERPRIIKQIADARTHGDLSENAEYHAAKEQQGITEARMADLEDKLSRADIIDVSKLKGDQVMFGATVTLVDINSAWTILSACRSRVSPARSSAQRQPPWRWGRAAWPTWARWRCRCRPIPYR